jgi:hypothetical protein
MNGIKFTGVLFSIKNHGTLDPTILKCDGEYIPATPDSYWVQGDPEELNITKWEQISNSHPSKIVDFDTFFEAFYDEFCEQAYALVYEPYLDSVPEPEFDDPNDWSKGLEQDEFLG